MNGYGCIKICHSRRRSARYERSLVSIGFLRPGSNACWSGCNSWTRCHRRSEPALCNAWRRGKGYLRSSANRFALEYSKCTRCLFIASK